MFWYFIVLNVIVMDIDVNGGRFYWFINWEFGIVVVLLFWIVFLWMFICRE